MKGYILLIAAVVVVSACKKTEVNVTPGLFGKWEIRRMAGGIAGSNTTYKPGNGTTYQFYSDSTYKQYFNGKFGAQGIFHIRSFFPPSGYNYEEIRFNNDTIGDRLIFSGTKLTISEAWRIDDGYAWDYVKIQDQ